MQNALCCNLCSCMDHKCVMLQRAGCQSGTHDHIVQPTLTAMHKSGMICVSVCDDEIIVWQTGCRKANWVRARVHSVMLA